VADGPSGAREREKRGKTPLRRERLAAGPGTCQRQRREKRRVWRRWTVGQLRWKPNAGGRGKLSSPRTRESSFKFSWTTGRKGKSLGGYI